MATKSKNKTPWLVAKKDRLFYILMIAWPVLQFCVFYIGVNVKSLTLSFQHIDVLNNVKTFTFDNVKESFQLLTSSKSMLHTELMSLVVYLISLITGVPLGLLFSFYISKKKVGAGAFRVLLFLPSIVSAIIMVTIYRFFVEEAVPVYLDRLFHIKSKGLISDDATRFGAIMFYNIFISFGTSVLMYSNRISACDPAMIEACHLDGATGIKEFWYVTLPYVFPTVTTFLVVGVAGIFTNQFNLFSFFGKEAPNDITTFGYYLYVQTANAKSEADYPALASLGLLLSIVTIALTFGVRKLLTTFGPSED